MAGLGHRSDATEGPLISVLQSSTREGLLRIVEPPFLAADHSAANDPLLPVVLSRSGRSLTSLKGCAGSLDRLLNYIVRSREHRGGDGEAHGFRGPQINH